MVNFKYADVSSPKYVQSRKVLLFGRLFPPLAYQSFRSFWSFPANSIWNLFMRQPVKQIAYKYCINFAKTKFPYFLTLSLRCNHWKIQNRGDSQDAINSIRCSPPSDCKPMTSVFYDVIRLESVRGRSNVLREGQFWLFLGNWNLKMLSAIVWTQKAFPYVTTRVLSHRAWNSMHGLLQLVSPGKKIKNK